VDWRGPRPRRNRHQAKRALGRAAVRLTWAQLCRPAASAAAAVASAPGRCALRTGQALPLLFCCNECRCLVSVQATPSPSLPLPVPATSSFFQHCNPFPALFVPGRTERRRAATAMNCPSMLVKSPASLTAIIEAKLSSMCVLYSAWRAQRGACSQGAVQRCRWHAPSVPQGAQRAGCTGMAHLHTGLSGLFCVGRPDVVGLTK
jgi:hypothetical protein